MAFGAVAAAAAHAWSACEDDVLRWTTKCCQISPAQSARPSCSNALRPTRPEQRCSMRSSNAERAAEQAGHLLQVTQSASSRLSSSAVQAGTTSRTTRAAWTAAPTSSRADGNHLVQHGRGATVSAAVGCRSDATACACADGAVQFYASIGARMPHADTRVPTHRAAAMRCRWSCGCSPYAPVRGYVPCAVCSDFASWVGFLSERLRPARGEKT